MIFGPEVMYNHPCNTPELINFYKGIHTAIREDCFFSSDHLSDYINPVSGKWRISLPFRSDKRLCAIKDDFYTAHDIDRERVRENCEDSSLLINNPDSDTLVYKTFSESYLMGVNRNYEFSDTAVLHSMVRALQMSSQGGVMFPRLEEDFNMKDLATTERIDMHEFVDLIMKKDVKLSYMDKLICYKDVWKAKMWVDKNMLNSCGDGKVRHQKSRFVRMHTAEMGVKATAKEILNCMFGGSKGVTSRIVRATEAVAELFDMDRYLMFTEPHMEIYKAMGAHKEYVEKGTIRAEPILNFKRFLDSHFKHQHYVDFSMISSHPDSGNVQRNLLNFYCDKSDPRFMKTISSSMERSEQKEDFLTLGGVGGDMSDYLESCIFESPDVILPSDDKLTRTMKLLKKKRWAPGMLRSMQVIFSQSRDSDRSYRQCYTDMEDFIVT